jgi:large subunit ribosomal protein L32
VEAGIKMWFANGFKSKQEVEADKSQKFDELNAERVARGKRPYEWDELYDDDDEKRPESKE